MSEKNRTNTKLYENIDFSSLQYKFFWGTIITNAVNKQKMLKTCPPMNVSHDTPLKYVTLVATLEYSNMKHIQLLRKVLACRELWALVNFDVLLKYSKTFFYDFSFFLSLSISFFWIYSFNSVWQGLPICLDSFLA